MADEPEPHYPLFCTTKDGLQVINEVLQAAAEEEQKEAPLKNLWVYISSRDQGIFPMPTPPLQRFKSDFINSSVGDLGVFCRTRFEKTDSICDQDFAFIDSRTLDDKTILFVRWERYTSEDDAILRIVWGQATPSDEKWLQTFLRTPEDRALLRKLQGKATREDEGLLMKVKEDTFRDDEAPTSATGEGRADASYGGAEAQTDRSKADSGLEPNEEEMAIASPTSPSLKRSSRAFDAAELSSAMRAATLLEGKLEAGPSNAEILEGWRTVRVPIATAMRDIRLIMRRSITDLLKMRSVFDKYGVLRY